MTLVPPPPPPEDEETADSSRASSATLEDEGAKEEELRRLDQENDYDQTILKTNPESSPFANSENGTENNVSGTRSRIIQETDSFSQMTSSSNVEEDNPLLQEEQDLEEEVGGSAKRPCLALRGVERTPSITVTSDGEDEDEQLLLEAQQVQSPVGSKQDYRLDFTEVEGTLEEIPEEVPASHSSKAPLCLLPSSSTAAEESPSQPQNSVAAAAAAATACPTAGASSCSSSVAPNNINNNNNNSASANPPPLASFHIPDSNASDVAYSEFSDSASQSTKPSFLSSYVKSTNEPLTAKQQVALWLTRTSMSDMSSMPSLRSLVFPNNNKSSASSASAAGKHHIHDHHLHHDHHLLERRGGGFRPGCTSTGEKKKVGGGKPSEIHRNFSTKSLINGYGASSAEKDPELMSPNPIRKCETVIALSGVSKSGGGGGPSSSSSHGGGRRSSLNIFKRLTRRSMNSASGSGGGAKMPAVARSCSGSAAVRNHSRLGGGGTSFSVTSGDNVPYGESGCESPFRVSLYLHLFSVVSGILALSAFQSLLCFSLSFLSSKHGRKYIFFLEFFRT